MAAISDYTSLVTSEYQSSPNFLAVVSLLAQWGIDRQNLLATFPQLFDIDLAVGQQLDMLGTWIGSSRNIPQIAPLPDATYRILLKALIALNHWDGTVPGAYSIWSTVFYAEGYQILIQDYQDMTMAFIFITPLPSTIQAIVLDGYFDLVPAGVRIVGYFQPSVPMVPAFGFGVTTANIAGFGVGAWVEPL